MTKTKTQESEEVVFSSSIQKDIPVATTDGSTDSDLVTALRREAERKGLSVPADAGKDEIIRILAGVTSKGNQPEIRVDATFGAPEFHKREGSAVVLSQMDGKIKVGPVRGDFKVGKRYRVPLNVAYDLEEKKNATILAR